MDDIRGHCRRGSRRLRVAGVTREVPDPVMPQEQIRPQAFFLHDRLLAATLDEHGRDELARSVERESRIMPTRDAAMAAAYEGLVGGLLAEAEELSLAAVAGSLSEDQLVTA